MNRVHNRVLPLIPVKNQGRIIESHHSGLVEIIQPRNGFIDRLVRLVRSTPEVMRIQLDDRGSFVWQAIDGNRNVEEIGRLLDAEFGKEAAPLYERLILFLLILKNNGFIEIYHSSNEVIKHQAAHKH
ncbi:MAG TPA: PqqD family protein [Clostridiales bacterium]|nr:PqqD family protein [Clostridiales bacterium]